MHESRHASSPKPTPSSGSGIGLEPKSFSLGYMVSSLWVQGINQSINSKMLATTSFAGSTQAAVSSDIRTQHCCMTLCINESTNKSESNRHIAKFGNPNVITPYVTVCVHVKFQERTQNILTFPFPCLEVELKLTMFECFKIHTYLYCSTSTCTSHFKYIVLTQGKYCIFITPMPIAVILSDVFESHLQNLIPGEITKY